MKNQNNLYMDIHILQTIPPSCINRDDTGSPKTAFYGGVARARVSSQAWKKAVRDMFRKEEIFHADDLGCRTKKIVGLIANEIKELNNEIDAEEVATNALASAGLKVKSVEKGTDALFFISTAQAKALARFAVEIPEIIEGKATAEQKKQAKKILGSYPGIDIALFGRMVADDASLNTDATAQVAHSISTHKVVGEYDYFTAVDDIANDSDAGAGHIGTVEFNSSTLYRYATVALHCLFDNLGGDTARAAQGFLKAFSLSMPTGKQNSFANRTIPYAVFVTFRKDQPINLVGAFERPVYAGHAGSGGYEAQSLNAFVEHTKNIYANWLDEPDKAFVVGNGLDELGEQISFPELLKQAGEYISEYVNLKLLDGEDT